ncbi:TPA: helix-turn-helix domain-containing protein [Clostridium botulinum]|uniref:helix-turn-helix domain-containing protein n=1 Tax=Clostridium TaxID=1485 RepID=UPI00090C4BBB|nr:helix-turn-helix transcriptional regulator [Clostridium botulinum]APC78491.1 helix-turn-helix family protein [Clostridium botulinum]APU61327.1 helix-turn-helix family protein [Clostridium botulinum]MCS4447128.1 helix-turn-helix domain-containing protein [Clostridium botulinum]MCS4457856.1 helix-turn-helix domain-containing protein [Clostridium botulinum]MCS4460532.1 helix-turn-helix domain-containing protein [Clostridium botulinum]
MITIGEVIKKERKKCSISQKELARRAQISNSFLCDIEKNRTKPSIATLFSICLALNIQDLNIFLRNIYVNTEK